MVLTRKKNLWIVFGFLILLTNVAIYQTSFGSSIISSHATGIVIGSLVDLAIIAPLSIMFAHDKFTIKKLILYTALGCITARIIIPMEYLEPFTFITWTGLALEGCIILIELYIVITMVRYARKILADIKDSHLPAIYKVEEAVERYVRPHFLMQVIIAEVVMFYYSLGTWRKKASEGITLHKNTNFMALHVMMIHAILVETIVIHWWLYSVSPILSFVLLILNIYSILFLLGNIQVMRLTPVLINEKHLYISYGLMKKAKIKYDNIDEVITDNNRLQQQLSKKTLTFVVREFDETYPSVILKMKKPVVATYYLGMQREHKEVAIKVDDPKRFLQQLQLKMQ